MEVIEDINRDDSIHGCLMFRPLPKHMDEAAACAALSPAKDVDGITAGSLAAVFSGSGAGYPPCTAQACLEILDHYGYELKGKRAVVVGPQPGYRQAGVHAAAGPSCHRHRLPHPHR